MMKRFVLRTLLALTPVWVIIGSYVFLDPYKILFSYDYESLPASFNYPFVPRQYHNIEKFIQQREKVQYNAFMLGTSQVLGFNVNGWGARTDEDLTPYVMWGAAESLFNLHARVRFLDSLESDLSGVIILLTVPYLVNTDEQFDLIRGLHPALSKRSELDYQINAFKSYINPYSEGYYFHYLKWNIKYFILSRAIELVQRYYIQSDPITNSSQLFVSGDPIDDRDIEPIMELDPANKQQYMKRVLADRHIEMLEEIHTILIKNKSKYYIIIAPLSDGRKIHYRDELVITRIFGKENVFDFSGNTAITRDPKYWDPTDHFRHVVGDIILDSILNKNRARYHLFEY